MPFTIHSIASATTLKTFGADLSPTGKAVSIYISYHPIACLVVDGCPGRLRDRRYLIKEVFITRVREALSELGYDEAVICWPQL